MVLTFKKSERLTSQLTIDKLFAGGNASFSAYPLRIVYMKEEKKEENSLPKVLISVPKKRFHHAVDRNRMKRLTREAYRLNKHILETALAESNFHLIVAFVCVADTLPNFHTVNKSMKKALHRVAEHL
ncbi:MAG: ribonuclease P protein component [Bacteroidales bacterium]|nr:ribonuclease P protein component [Bacteroidales bacterium]